MKRVGMVTLLAVFAGAAGCAAPATFVEKKPDQGVVAIPANTNTWPSYNRREALALIQQHVGPNYEIVGERLFVKGQVTHNNQQVNTEQTANRRHPNLPGERQTVTSTSTTNDVTEWHIAYRRKAGPAMGTTALTPAGGPTVQTRYPTTGGVVPAGGALPPGGAECNH